MLLLPFFLTQNHTFMLSLFIVIIIIIFIIIIIIIQSTCRVPLIIISVVIFRKGERHTD